MGSSVDIPTLNELTGKEAAKSAAREQRRAASQNIALQRDMTEEQARQFDLMRQDYAPFREAGVAQLPMLQQMAQGGPETSINAFQADPGYQWQLEQGLGAIENRAAAGGGLESGRTLKALQGYGQNLANQQYQQWRGNQAADYGNQFNRLASLAGIGQTTTGQMANLGQNQMAMQQQGLGNIMGQNQMTANANAAAQMQGYQGMSNLIGQGMMAYALSDERAKDDIEDSELGLEFVKKLRPVRWKYKGDAKTHDGLIAQELKKAMEEAGIEGEMHADEEIQGIRYGELIGPIIKAIKDLDAKVEAKNG